MGKDLQNRMQSVGHKNSDKKADLNNENFEKIKDDEDNTNSPIRKKSSLKSMLKQSQQPLFSVPVEQALKTIERNKRLLMGMACDDNKNDTDIERKKSKEDNESETNPT